MNIILYSTGCPKCNVLKKKLDSKNISYKEENDLTVVIEKGYSSAPILFVDGTFYEFSDAVKFLNTL